MLPVSASCSWGGSPHPASPRTTHSDARPDPAGLTGSTGAGCLGNRVAVCRLFN